MVLCASGLRHAWHVKSGGQRSAASPGSCREQRSSGNGPTGNDTASTFFDTGDYLGV